MTAPSGYATTERITAAVDRAAPEIDVDELPPRLTSDPALTLSGHTEPGANLRLNGKAVDLVDGRFSLDVPLAEGANALELTATDTAGNVTVDKWTVRLDRDAPRLVASTLTQTADAGGTALNVEIVADDASGLAKAAAVRVAAGADTYSGYLRYNRASRSYQGSIPVPAEIVFLPVTVEVELEDDAGNARTYPLPLTEESGEGTTDTEEDQ